ncbi:hypothetical protein CHU98_g10598 [Xylaria longipes]|nr:hypothetical protein CHU98_g10598 [Xylaria longipes]
MSSSIPFKDGIPHPPGFLPDTTLELLSDKDVPQPGRITRSASKTMSAEPPQPVTPGLNPETIDFILRQQQATESSVKSLRRDIKDIKSAVEPVKNLGQELSGLMQFQRHRYQIPEDVPLLTASDWSAFQGTRTRSGTDKNMRSRSDNMPPPQPKEKGTQNPAAPPAESGNPGASGEDPPGDDPDDDPDDDPNGHRRSGWDRGATPGAVSAFTEGGTHKIKRDDIGILNPEWDDPEDRGVVADGKDIIYTDACMFTSRINALLEHEGTRASNTSQIMGLFDHLLAGSALLWWNEEVDPNDRRIWRKAGLDEVLLKLEDRFKTRPGHATKKFLQGRLTLYDIATNRNAIPQYIQRKLRYARANGTLARDNSNWAGVMENIRDQWDDEILDQIRAPKDKETLHDYMQKVEKARHGLERRAERRYPNAKPIRDFPKGEGSDRNASRSSKSSFRQNDFSPRRRSDRGRRSSGGYRRSDDRYRRNGDYRRDDDRPRYDKDRRRDDRDKDRSRDREGSRERDRSRDRSRDGSRERDRNRDRDRDRDGSRDRSRDRDRDRHRRDDRRDDGRNRVHFVDDTDEGNESQYESDRGYYSGASYYVLNSSLTCHKCHKQYESAGTLKLHVRKCRPSIRLEKMTTTSPVDPARRTCGYCKSVLSSRNELFRHLGQCPDAKKGKVRKDKSTSTPNSAEKKKPVPADEVPDEEVPVEKAPSTDRYSKALRSSYTYLRFKARAAPTGPDVEVCADPGTGRTIIGQDYLNTLEHSVEDRKGIVTTVGDTRVALDKWAKFKFYTRGVDGQGKPKIIEHEKEGWVVDEKLQPGMLIGNDFLHPHEAVIDYSSGTITFRGLSDFTIVFEVLVRSRECVRKVVNTRNVTIGGGEKAYVQVDYKPLPADRSFCFMAIHEAAMHAVVDAKTPKVVPIVNTAKTPVKIHKGTKLGQIRENNDSGSHVSSWKSAMKTLAVAAVALAAPVANVVGSGSPATANSVIAVNAEFDMSPMITATATGTVPDNKSPVYMDELANSTPMTPTEVHASAPPTTGARLAGTPLTDAVFNMITGVPPPDEPYIAPLIEPPKPKIPDSYATSGIKRPADAPENVTKNGIHIYAEKASEAAKFAEIVEAYDIWIDKGEVDIPEDQQLKIPLVDNWQETKLNARAYPLSRRDMQVLNDTHDRLHDMGRMEWMDEATPFAHPVFVTWRKVHGVDKGRVVVDLRQLNKVAVPDSYPLPLQSEVIGSLRGKQYVTCVDATGFFHQFKVHPDYKDRFTIISPRGMERSNVALMGYCNSPGYVQRYMDKLFRSHSQYCRCFIDDIIIFSDTFEEHIQHLHTIFGLFQTKNIAMSPKKSFIGYPSVELLGFRVDALGLSNTKDRVQAFQQLAFPKNLQALEQYLGASGFLRTLIPYYAQLAEPLQRRKTTLLAKGRKEGRVVNGNPGRRKHYVRTTNYEPTPAELASFRAVQDAICSETTLHHHDPDRILYLQVDGSRERGFGVMLFHTKRGFEYTGDPIPAHQIEPVMYLSRCLSQAETRYGPSELEVACLVWATKKLRTVVHSNKHSVIVLTDHSSTKGILDQTSLDTSATDRANIRLVNSSVYLSQYGYQVYHLPGRLNYVPDALSRLTAVQDASDESGRLKRSDEPAVLDSVWNVVEHTAEAIMSNDWKRDFRLAYKADHRYSKILDELCIDELRVKRLCVPHGMIERMMHAVHDEKHHAGPERMMEDLEPYSIYRKSWLVKKYASCCPGCDVNTTDRLKPVGSLRPIRPKDALPMQTIAIDFILALPRVKSLGTPWQLKGQTYHDTYNCMMTVSCHASKRTLLIPGNERYTAEDWATALTKQLLLSDWGIPRGIISDRDRKFTSDFWRGMWKALGTKLLMTTAYHPQGDGLSERKNQTVEIAIRFHNYYNPESNWVDLAPLLQWNLNTARSQAMQSTPHEQLFGFKLPGPLDILLGQTDNRAFKEVQVLRGHLRQDAKLAMDFAAAQSKRQFDSKHRALEFSPGDKVLLRLHDGYHLPGKPHKKYSQQRAGPWTVKRRIGDLAYELDFPSHYQIHPVVSVAQLRPVRSDEDPFRRSMPPPGPVEADQHSDSESDAEGDIYEVEIILQHRPNRKRDGFDYLIKWKGWGHQHNRWQSEHDLRHSQDLVTEYWARHGPRPEISPRKTKTKRQEQQQEPTAADEQREQPKEPTIADGRQEAQREPTVVDAPRRRGRPRKSPAPVPASVPDPITSLVQPVAPVESVKPEVPAQPEKSGETTLVRRSARLQKPNTGSFKKALEATVEEVKEGEAKETDIEKSLESTIDDVKGTKEKDVEDTATEKVIADV